MCWDNNKCLQGQKNKWFLYILSIIFIYLKNNGFYKPGVWMSLNKYTFTLVSRHFLKFSIYVSDTWICFSRKCLTFLKVQKLPKLYIFAYCNVCGEILLINRVNFGVGRDSCKSDCMSEIQLKCFVMKILEQWTLPMHLTLTTGNQ